MAKVESERIVNIADLEELIVNARFDMVHLRNLLKDGNQEASKHLVEQLDLKLHKMEAFEFIIERRIISESNLREDR